MTVDFKQIRKVLEECVRNVKDDQKKIQINRHDIGDLRKQVMNQLKNSDCEKTGLNRELNRMQNIDRIKVAHASSNFYNPDTGTLLPSLDSAYANSG